MTKPTPLNPPAKFSGPPTKPGRPAPPDATLAISENALTKLVRSFLDQPIKTSGSGHWGPFVASYGVSLAVSGGSIQLVQVAGDDIVRLSNVIVDGSVSLSAGIDLGDVLPHICIPPWRACLNTPWGSVCTPQVCISWPTISIPIGFPIPPLGLSADFGIGVKQDGDNWDIGLYLYPFSIYIDLTPSVNAILDAARAFVQDTIGKIPLIGGLLASLVDTVINVLQSVLDAILAAIAALVRTAILAIDVFSPTIPLSVQKIPAKQVILPASGAGDAEVALVISAVAVTFVPATTSPSPQPGELDLSLTFS